jgi:hypothetical protein
MTIFSPLIPSFQIVLIPKKSTTSSRVPFALEISQSGMMVLKVKILS